MITETGLATVGGLCAVAARAYSEDPCRCCP